MLQLAAAGDEPEVMPGTADDLTQPAVGRSGDVIKGLAEGYKFFPVVAVQSVLGSQPHKAEIVRGNVDDAVLGKSLVDGNGAERVRGALRCHTNWKRENTPYEEPAAHGGNRFNR